MKHAEHELTEDETLILRYVDHHWRTHGKGPKWLEIAAVAGWGWASVEKGPDRKERFKAEKAKRLAGIGHLKFLLAGEWLTNEGNVERGTRLGQRGAEAIGAGIDPAASTADV